METVKEKSLPLAIGLNLLLPGLGYIYMGKWIVGVFACLLIAGIYATTAILALLLTWLVMNVVMIIDMIILSGKNKKQLIEQTTKKCPSCTELIQRDAKICRFCGAKFDAATDTTATPATVNSVQSAPPVASAISENKKNKVAIIGVAIVGLVIVIAVIARYIPQKQSGVVEPTATLITSQKEVAPYTEEANFRLLQALQATEAPNLSPGNNKDKQEAVTKLVAYYIQVYEKAGFSFAKSLARHYDHLAKNGGVPDMRPTAQTILQIDGQIRAMQFPGLDYNVVFPGKDFDSIRAYLKPDTKEVGTKEKTGVCAGLQLTAIPDRQECSKRKYAEAENQLNARYRETALKLDPTQQSTFKELQLAWLKEATEKCNDEGKEAEGGILQPIIILDCGTKETTQRTAFLQNYKP